MARLPANKWVTVGSLFGTAQRMLHVVVAAAGPCEWRERFGPFKTSSGSFRHRHSFRVFNQTVQIKSPIETTFESQFDEAPDLVPQSH
jgi:hypothetical protein